MDQNRLIHPLLQYNSICLKQGAASDPLISQARASKTGDPRLIHKLAFQRAPCALSHLDGHPAKPMTRNRGNRKKLSSWEWGGCSKISATLAQFVFGARAAEGRGNFFMASRGQLAKRALVKVLLALAAVYGLVVNVSRDSADDAVKAAYRRVVRRAAVAPPAFAHTGVAHSADAPSARSLKHVLDIARFAWGATAQKPTAAGR